MKYIGCKRERVPHLHLLQCIGIQPGIPIALMLIMSHQDPNRSISRFPRVPCLPVHGCEAPQPPKFLRHVIPDGDVRGSLSRTFIDFGPFRARGSPAHSYSSLRRNEARNSWGAFPRWNCYCGGKDRIGGQGKLSGGFASFAFSKVPRKVPFTSPACNGKTLPPRFCTVCAWKSYCYARLHPPILRGGIRSRGERERREYECVRYMRVNVVSLVRYMQHGHSHFCVCVCVCVCVNLARRRID
jgi:hypothetical protein